MPLTQISTLNHITDERKQAVMDGIYAAMRETFAVPEGDRFMTVSEYAPADFSYGVHYPGVERSDDLVIIQITVSNNRTREQKLALYNAINKELGERANYRPDDIFINIVEVLPENWSFGLGRAQNIE